MSFQIPPVVKLAERVLLEVEQIVRHFPRYHKYVMGTRLREQALNVATLCHRAWRDRSRQGEWLGRLVFAVDDFKLSVQLAKQVHAFKSFAQFEALARLVSDLGRQCGGWKKQHSQGQNAATSKSAQRPQILSSRDASSEARL